MIGIFDSGLGGLTILKEIKAALPEYDYLYYGDTLHVPYGNRSDEAVFLLTRNACDYLFAHGARLIVVACNTASSRALRRLQQEYLPVKRAEMANENLNILGVIRPLVEFAAQKTKGRVGVIATRGTVNSHTYMVELKKENPQINVFQYSCPLLVPLIEEGWSNRPETISILRYYLRDLKREQVDTLILGCTHYPLLLRRIRAIMGHRCLVPNPGEIVARSLREYLLRHPDIGETLSRGGSRSYLVTDLTENFKKTAQNFLDEKIEIIKI